VHSTADEGDVIVSETVALPTAGQIDDDNEMTPDKFEPGVTCVNRCWVLELQPPGPTVFIASGDVM
jgi:hypothetical protein